MTRLATGTWKELTRSGSDRALAAVILAACIVVPLLFTIAIYDTFALPKVTALRIIVVVGLALLAVRLALGGVRRTALVGLVDIAVLAFVALNIAAFAFSIDPGQSLSGEYLQYQGLLSILLYVGFFYLARASLADERRVGLLFASIAAGGTVVAVYALVQKAGFDPIWSYTPEGRVFSTIGQPNALAAYLLLAIPVSASLLPRSQRLVRGALLLSVGMMVAALALTLSRGGYAGFVVAAVIMAIPLIRSLRLTPRRLLSGLTLCLVAAVVVGTLVQPVRATATQVWSRAVSSAGLDDSSARMHLDMWNVGAQIALDNPVLGTGRETYPELFPQYRDTVLGPSRAQAFMPFRPESPHNVYVAIASGAGFPALAAYVGVLAGFFFLVGRALKATRSGWRRIALVALLAAVAGHVVTDTFMTAEVTSSWLFWVLLGAGLGIAGASHRGRDGPSSPAPAP